MLGLFQPKAETWQRADHPLKTGMGLERKGVVPMVSYADLFQYTLVLLGVIGLVVAIYNRRNK